MWQQGLGLTCADVAVVRHPLSDVLMLVLHSMAHTCETLKHLPCGYLCSLQIAAEHLGAALQAAKFCSSSNHFLLRVHRL